MKNELSQRFLPVARDTARKAGALLSSYFQGSYKVGKKSSAADMVTEADRASEELITTALRKHFPDHAVLGEEQGHTASPGQSGYTWVIDPLDGTTNFVHGLPIYAVSIALAYENTPVLGVVYLPHFDCLYSAVRDGGAFKNRHALSVSMTEDLADSIIATGIPYDRASSSDNNLKYITTLTPKIQGIRRLGVAALDLCLVAEGAIDAYWEVKVQLWDILAGICIAREAGATASYINSGNYVHVLAAGPNLYPLLLKELQATDSHFSSL